VCWSSGTVTNIQHLVESRNSGIYIFLRYCWTWSRLEYFPLDVKQLTNWSSVGHSNPSAEPLGNFCNCYTLNEYNPTKTISGIQWHHVLVIVIWRTCSARLVTVCLYLIYQIVRSLYLMVGNVSWIVRNVYLIFNDTQLIFNGNDVTDCHCDLFNAFMQR
jgi:hypothetical protein